MDRRAAARLGTTDPPVAARALTCSSSTRAWGLAASSAPDGFEPLPDELIAPPLLWSEVVSVLHEAVWRGDISRDLALRSLEVFTHSDVRERWPRRLSGTAWRIADELGFSETYDAEYLALAELSGCQLVTLDRRLRRGADRLGYVVSPDEL